MSKINNTITNPGDIIIGLLIYNYSKQSFLRHVKCKNEDGVAKTMTGERIYETIVKLLAEGALYVEMLDNDNLTIVPETDAKKRTKCQRFVDIFSGKYNELATIQREMDKFEEARNEQN